MWLTSKPRSGKLQTRARLILVEEGPEDRTIRAGKATPWAGQPGGATQLQVFDENNRAVSVSKLLGVGILKGKEDPVGLHG